MLSAFCQIFKELREGGESLETLYWGGRGGHSSRELHSEKNCSPWPRNFNVWNLNIGIALMGILWAKCFRQMVKTWPYSAFYYSTLRRSPYRNILEKDKELKACGYCRQETYLYMWWCDSGLWGESSSCPHSLRGSRSSNLWPGWSRGLRSDMGLGSSNRYPARAERYWIESGEPDSWHSFCYTKQSKTHSILPTGCARKQHTHSTWRKGEKQGRDIGAVLWVWASALRNVSRCSQEQLQQSTPF